MTRVLLILQIFLKTSNRFCTEFQVAHRSMPKSSISLDELVIFIIDLPVIDLNSSAHCLTISLLGAITITRSTCESSINNFAIVEAQIVFPAPGAASIKKIR